MSTIDNSMYAIRRLRADEVFAYKAMRLEALQLEPGMFGNSYALEAAFPQPEWEERLTDTNRACFGLFCNNEFIGITCIIRDKENPAEAYMTQTYIRKEHRGRRLSRMLYDCRIDWAKANGIKTLTIGHRETNLASKNANQRFGFIYSHREPRTWPDGVTEDMVYYALQL